MKYATRPMFGLAVTLALAAACDDSKGDTSGVSGSKSATEVNDAEAKTLCRWMNEFLPFRFTVEQGCTVDGVEETSSAAECRDFVEECRQHAEASPGEDEPEEEDTCDEAVALKNSSPGCSKITVGDFESCVRTLKRLTRDFYTGASCDKRELPEAEYPPLCARIAVECPEIPLRPAESVDEPSPGL